jgi:putative ABC transport system permease protein
MFLRIITESFTRTPRRKFLTGAALALGMAIATATLTVALNVGDRLAAEFRSLGANLLVTPKADTLPLEVGGVDYRPVNAGAYLPVDDLPKLKEIFWRNNIKGFTPFLDVPAATRLHDDSFESINSSPSGRATLIGTWVRHNVKLENGETFETGVDVTNPWWRIEDGGRWFNESADECVVGVSLAQSEKLRVGDNFWIGTETEGPGTHSVRVHVTGILSTGGSEDEAIVVPLAIAQKLAGQPGKFRRLMVSAVVKPDDAFGRSDPKKLSGADYERWYCSAYIGSISLQIEQILPGAEARAVRQVAEGEGKILGRISVLLWIVTLAALIAAGLAVGSTAATSVLERQKEVGLMKALGASNSLVGAFFIGEQLLLALFGGGLGYAIGVLLARWLSITVFGVSSPARMIMLPVTIGLAVIVAVVGSLFPLRRASRFDPAPILRGE